LFKRFSGVNASKYFYISLYRLNDIWNSLPVTVVEAPSVTVFGRLMDRPTVYFSSFCMTLSIAAVVVKVFFLVKVFCLAVRAGISGFFKPSRLPMIFLSLNLMD